MISIKEIEDFKSNSVWKVFKAEMEVMRKNVLETMVKETELMAIGRSQGRAEVLVDLMMWPDLQLEEAERDNEKVEKENEDE